MDDDDDCDMLEGVLRLLFFLMRAADRIKCVWVEVQIAQGISEES